MQAFKSPDSFAHLSQRIEWNVAAKPHITSWEDMPSTLVKEVGCFLSLEDIQQIRHVDRRCWRIFTSPTFFNFRRTNSTQDNEVLCFVSDRWLSPAPQGLVMAYIPSMHSWRAFGIQFEKNGSVNNTVSGQRGYENFQTNPICSGSISDSNIVYLPKNGEIFYLGGRLQEDTSCNNNVWSYSFFTNQWQQQPSMNRSRSGTGLSSAAVVGSNIFVIGADSESEDERHKNDPCHCECLLDAGLKGSKWVDIPSAPVDFRPSRKGVAVTHNRFVSTFMFTQIYNGESVSGFIYDSKMLSWTGIPLPKAHIRPYFFPLLCNMVTFQEKVAFIRSDVSSVFIMFDPLTYEWTSHFAAGRRCLNIDSSLFVYHGQISMYVPHAGNSGNTNHAAPNNCPLECSVFWQLIQNKESRSFHWQPLHLQPLLGIDHRTHLRFFTAFL